MLSYRHSFHAGNFADVLKHIVVAEILAYLCQKDKPFDYIDTHAGAGQYSLNSERAQKTGEFLDGVAKLQPTDWPELTAYFDVIAKYNPKGELSYYPGSPGVALHYLRPQDRGWLFELHSKDYPLLSRFAAQNPRVDVNKTDGLRGMLALVPPKSRRALVLIDPSYEVKTDYLQVVDSVIAALRKFATGIYAIWYPVLNRTQVDWFERKFVAAGIRNIQVFELGVSADAVDAGMTSSCMLVINPPWQLKPKLDVVLPRLAAALGRESQGFCRAITLCPE